MSAESYSRIWSLVLSIFFIFTFISTLGVRAYIPASPVNDTGVATNGSLPSHLDLQWYGGGYQEDISYQLVGADTTGISKVCSLTIPVRPPDRLIHLRLSSNQGGARPFLRIEVDQ